MNSIRNTISLSIFTATVSRVVKPLLSIIILMLTAFSSVGIALADFGGDHNGEGYHMGWGGEGGMMMFGPVMMIGLVVLIVLVVMLLMNRGKHVLGQDANTTVQPSSAVTTLDERYAKGEIDHDEYEERKRRLLA